jgi:hypothetical protein
VVSNVACLNVAVNQNIFRRWVATIGKSVKRQ